MPRNDIIDTSPIRSRIAMLADHRQPHSFSILIPTHRTHPESDQDPIRLKNAIDEVAGKLEADGMKGSVIDELLSPVRRHLDDRAFWQHRDLGLAVFGSPGTDLVELSVPVPFTAATYVGERFHFRPLLPALDDVIVPTLLLARGGVSFHEVSGEGARRVPIELPDSIDDINWFTDRESELQQRANPPTAVGGFHGHTPEDDEDDDLRRYLRAVADAVEPALVGRDAPLVVAAAGDLPGRIEPHIEHDIIARPALDPAASEATITSALRDVHAELLAERRRASLDHMNEVVGRGQHIDDLEEALFAGVEGRIDTLALVVETDPVWGTIDETTHVVTRHDERRNGDEDLIDRLAGLTLSRGGAVHALREPLDERTFVAIPRY